MQNIKLKLKNLGDEILSVLEKNQIFPLHLCQLLNQELEILSAYEEMTKSSKIFFSKYTFSELSVKSSDSDIKWFFSYWIKFFQNELFKNIDFPDKNIIRLIPNALNENCLQLEKFRKESSDNECLEKKLNEFIDEWGKVFDNTSMAKVLLTKVCQFNNQLVMQTQGGFQNKLTVKIWQNVNDICNLINDLDGEYAEYESICENHLRKNGLLNKFLIQIRIKKYEKRYALLRQKAIKCGITEEDLLPDFFSMGDKLIAWKQLLHSQMDKIFQTQFNLIGEFIKNVAARINNDIASVEEIIQKYYEQLKNVFVYIYEELHKVIEINNFEDNLRLEIQKIDNKTIIPVKHAEFVTYCTKLNECINYMLSNWHEVTQYILFQLYKKKSHCGKIIEIFSNTQENDWEKMYNALFYRRLLDTYSYAKNYQLPNSKTLSDLKELYELSDDLRNDSVKIIHKTWQERRKKAIHNIEKHRGFKTLFALRQGKNTKKLSLREIMHREFEQVTELFPVIMTNPQSADAILPLKCGLFDIVIFDEASQLRIENVFSSMMRGRYKIIAGDSHQMPPSNYFARSIDSVNDTSEENPDLSPTDAESLLEYAEEKYGGEKSVYSYLDFHYRSRHPALIEFSNKAFYGGNLCPLPESEKYNPFVFFQLNGKYEKHVNELEADKVIEILYELGKKYEISNLPSVGIATFSLAQRNFVINRIHDEASKDDEFATIYTALENMPNKIFVKNLENIQGDERDVIIISTTYGLNTEGKFRQQTILSRNNSYRLLNVLVTRAKEFLYLLTSISEKYWSDFQNRIETDGNDRNPVLYAYINYVKSVAEGKKEEAQSTLDFIQKYSHSEPRRQQFDSSLTESPFEDEVYQRLIEIVPSENVHCQFHVGGYRLDFMVQCGDKQIAIECDGKTYHQSEQAYAEDMYRQKIIERQGYTFYRIWSTDWFREPEREIKKLRVYLESLS